ncbi:MAG: ImuA family protein [Candidatus Puniceispirillaceae bacterium]
MATISDRIEIPAPHTGEGCFSNENQHAENHDASSLNGDSGAGSGYSAGCSGGYSTGYLADGRRSHFHQLRRDVARLEGYIDSPRLALGVDVLDSALAGGLALGRAHMLCGRPGHDAALTGFAAALVRRLMARKDGPVVWCPAAAMGGSGMLYAAGFSALGIDPSRLLIVDAPSPTRRLAALEDILRTEGLAAVVVEYDGLNQSSDYWMRLARRAQLAAEASGTTGFLLGWPVAASGFDSLWHVAPGRRQETDAISSAATSWHPVWDIRIAHARGGRPCRTGVLWDSFADRFQSCQLANMAAAADDMPARLPFADSDRCGMAGPPRSRRSLVPGQAKRPTRGSVQGSAQIPAETSPTIMAG